MTLGTIFPRRKSTAMPSPKTTPRKTHVESNQMKSKPRKKFTASTPDLSTILSELVTNCIIIIIFFCVYFINNESPL